jgi:PPM family protein phosphatase
LDRKRQTPYNPKVLLESTSNAHPDRVHDGSKDRMKIRAGIEFSGQSDIGCLRQNNEDSFGYWEPDDDRDFERQGRLAIVADGMGGYEGGQEASRLAVETLIAVYRAYEGDDPQQALINGLQGGHEEIRRYGSSHPELRGMGTTCTAIAIVHNGLYYVHVGDTRLYLIRDGQINQVTRDHSYVGRLVEAGMLSREEAEKHPQRNILTAAVGTAPELMMDSPGRPEPLRPQDVLVICTDGLWGQVHDGEILSAVENHKNLEDSSHELIELARERGGPDNITVNLLRLR